MIIAIAASSDVDTAVVEPQYTHCPFFAIYKGNQLQFIENPARDSNSYELALETLLGEKVTTVIASEFGPKAQNQLEERRIRMIVPQNKSLTIKQIVNKIN